MWTGSGAPYRAAAAVLDGIKDEFAEEGLVLPDRVCVLNGAIAWDNVETCGQLAVAATRFYFSDAFPSEQPGSQSNGKAALFVVDYVAQIVRCAPQMSDRGEAPSCESLDRSAQIVLQDAWAVAVAVTCTLEALTPDSIIDWAVRAQMFLGPEGGGVGSELPFTVCLERA